MQAPFTEMMHLLMKRMEKATFNPDAHTSILYDLCCDAWSKDGRQTISRALCKIAEA